MSEPANIEAFGLSQTGSVREDNQDAIRVSESEGRLHAVADGMGGYSHGGVASATALDTFFSTFYSDSPPKPARTMRRAIEMANLAVYQTAQRLGVARIGTTLTAIYVQGTQAHIAHVGDSRAYLVRQGKATCLTNDHTTVGDLVRMKVLSPDKVRTHNQRSILNKCLGVQLFVQPDITSTALQEGDRLILCSDGLWSVIEDDEFARMAGEISGVDTLCQSLIDLALQRETDDNVSAIAVHIHRLVEEEAGERQGRGFGGLLRNILNRGSDPASLSIRVSESV